jgi:GT2 family glycosyltransferase
MSALSIIIINWNSKALLLKCLASIALHETELDYEVLVIDNHSDDDFDDVRPDFPENYAFIKLEENLGFGRACNMAASRAKGEILLFLGPDTELLRDNDLCNLRKTYAADPHRGALGCQFVTARGERQYSSVPFPSPANIVKAWWRENIAAMGAVRRALLRSRTIPVIDTVEPCDAVLGHCLMVSNTRFRQVGGFPPDVFLFSEDIELCKKLRLAGYFNAKDNRCKIVHHQHRSIREKYGWDFIYLVQESLVHFNVRYHGRMYGALAAFLTVLRALWSLAFFWAFSVKGNFRETIIRNGKILQYYLFVRFRRKSAG